MNNGTIVTMLKDLKLNGFAESFNELMSLPLQMRPGLDVCVARMIEAEQCHRNNARTQKLLKAAKLRYGGYIEDIECSASRNLLQSDLSEIASCSFVRRGENLLITGLTGVGKSYLACAVGRQACTLGIPTLYVNLNRFLETVAQAHLDGTMEKLLNKLHKYDLLILDDFGLRQLTPDARLALLQILEDRFECKSLIIASQLPVANWYEYINDNTLADAIMDRLVNNSIHMDLKGESMRKRKRYGK